MNLLLAIKISAGDSLLVLVIGMLVIFSVLAILVLTVLSYVNIFRAFDKKKKSEPVQKNVPAPVAQPVAIKSDDGELIAAITAAISLMLAAESETGEVAPFRVKSIIRKH